MLDNLHCVKLMLLFVLTASNTLAIVQTTEILPILNISAEDTLVRFFVFRPTITKLFHEPC